VSETASHSSQEFASRLNWLRAGVLGANDGIVSIAALVVGVAAATENLSAILIAGVSGVVAGAISMAAGEYVSVSSQRDSERGVMDRESGLLEANPEEELAELQKAWETKGLSAATAAAVAKELTEHDALAAHFEVQMGSAEPTLTNPWHAAISSFFAFIAGALLPLLSVILVSPAWWIPATVIASLIALALTGGISAKLGDAHIGRAVFRVTVGGALALAITWGIGELLGTSLAL